MEEQERSRELFVTCGTENRIYICADAARYLRGPISVLAGNGVVALVNDPAGKLQPRTRGERTQAVELFVSGLRKFLTKYLNVPAGRRIPAVYDRRLDGLVLGPVERFAALGQGVLAPAYPQQVRKVNCRVEENWLVLETHLPTRSNALVWGDMLALRRESIGQVVVEPAGEQRVIRRPDVVDFCRGHWLGREVYARMVGSSTVLSWDLVGLALLQDIEKFQPLRVGRKAAMDLRRDRSIFLTPAAAQLLRGKLATYVCGPTVALVNDPAGDVEPEPEGKGAAIHSTRLYWQITRSYPLSSRLYFHAQGNLLVLSREEGDVILPPEEDFCRLLTGTRPTPARAKLALGG